MDPKPQTASKTIWVNVAVLVAAVLALPEVGAVLPEEALPWIAVSTPILNMVLRQFTTQPVKPLL